MTTDVHNVLSPLDSDLIHIAINRMTEGGICFYMVGPFTTSGTDRQLVYNTLIHECKGYEKAEDPLTTAFELHGHLYFDQIEEVRDDDGEMLFTFESHIEFNEDIADLINKTQLNVCAMFVVDLYQLEPIDKTKPDHTTFADEREAREFLMDYVRHDSRFLHGEGEKHNPRFSTHARTGRTLYKAWPMDGGEYVTIGAIRKILGTSKVRLEVFNDVSDISSMIGKPIGQWCNMASMKVSGNDTGDLE